MMDAETEFRERLVKKINKGIADATEQIVSGGSYVPDFENYHYRVGYLRALSQCLDLCAEVTKDMSK